MKLNEEQAFKVAKKILEWAGLELVNSSDTGIGQIQQSELSDFVMLDLINFELD